MLQQNCSVPHLTHLSLHHFQVYDLMVKTRQGDGRRLVLPRTIHGFCTPLDWFRLFYEWAFCCVSVISLPPLVFCHLAASAEKEYIPLLAFYRVDYQCNGGCTPATCLSAAVRPLRLLLHLHLPPPASVRSLELGYAFSSDASVDENHLSFCADLTILF